MAKSKKQLTDAQKRKFIETDLYHELRCLLGSATVWRAFQVANAGFDVVIAMDAAFVHARNLFNFFMVSRYEIPVTQFGPASAYKSRLYKLWKSALHQHVLHFSERRLRPNNTRNGQHLNEQVEVFAREILTLWIQLEGDPQAAKFRGELRAARSRAIKDAAHDAAGRIRPLF